MLGAYRINSPAVVSEIIDGEAVIMNLVTGNYFSTSDTGCLIWSWIEQGISRQSIARRLAGHHDVTLATLYPMLDTFFADLLGNGLVVEVETTAPDTDDLPVEAVSRAPLRPPVLEVYTDMRDMLLLDPIHDVDNVGWPTAAPAADPANGPAG